MQRDHANVHARPSKRDRGGFAAATTEGIANMPSDRVRAATTDDLRWLVHLRDKPASREAGYIPTGGLIDAIEQARCVIAEREGQPAGFIVYRKRKDGVLHVPSVCIEEELWRSGLGSRCVRLVEHRGMLAGCHAMTCKVAYDAPAVSFWRELMGDAVVSMPGRRRWLLGFVKPLNRHDSPPSLPPHSQWQRKGLAWSDLPPPPHVTATHHDTAE